MSHKLEETFETLLGSPRRAKSESGTPSPSPSDSKPSDVEATEEATEDPDGTAPEGFTTVADPVEDGLEAGTVHGFETAPEGTNGSVVPAGASSTDPEMTGDPPEAIPCTGGTEISVEAGPAPPDLEQVEIPCEPEDAGDAVSSPDPEPAPGPKGAGSPEPSLEEIPPDPDGFVVEHIEHQKVVTYSKGTYLVPNYVSDYLLKNLSLAEQSVFNRLYRISAGFFRRTQPLTISDLAESCGLNPKFTATVIKSLVSKKLVKVIWGNPLSRKVRFKLILPKEVEKRIVLCGVCHDLIHEEEEWEYYPVARSVNGRVQTIVAHVRCIPGEPFSSDTSS